MALDNTKLFEAYIPGPDWVQVFRKLGDLLGIGYLKAGATIQGNLDIVSENYEVRMLITQSANQNFVGAWCVLIHNGKSKAIIKEVTSTPVPPPSPTPNPVPTPAGGLYFDRLVDLSTGYAYRGTLLRIP